MTKDKDFFLKKKKLSSFSTEGEDFCKFDKAELVEKTKELGDDLADLQELIFAESKYKILIILQGLDTSGKDGTVKHVFGATNPQGVRVVSFKAPTELELAHDYMWRIHKEAPEKGELVIFNRSHYEDYIVPRVHGTLNNKLVRQRMDDIKAFEKMLAAQDFVIFKFFLHISLSEQAERLRERLDNAEKHWKFQLSDLTERRHWREYHKAYEEIIQHTHTDDCPWYIIPADNKPIRNYLISKILVHRLKNLKSHLPEFNPKVIKKLKEEAQRILPHKK
ncbi:PPK2 family polyphosphate kinase [Bdellovibrio sp. NC01]|uniref:PPK2 family polyphosphate kinase n=1 Tax=Bdellovibrio sp. NC01 TaxID=2220073 RepID=UPI0011584F92|nr:PPK2 family polyphosphate kinase [Bdellovibrio sp. NC01]QDK37297.1 polyphosphate kinase 2 family protein [Bdellovibrio sp. NC01]